MTMGLGYAILVLTIYVLAVARVTRFVNHDDLIDPLRIALARAFGPASKLMEFLGCPWCISIWVAAASAWIPVMIVGLPWWWMFLVILATSHLVGVAAPLAFTEELSYETVKVD